MKAFITGISGFVGKHLADFLISKHIEVFGIDIADGFERNSKVHYSKADIFDSKALTDLLSNINPDYIFHLAGYSSVKKSFEQPELCKKINVLGSKSLFDAVLASGIQPKILIISSADIYGIPKKLPLVETHELHPVSPYAESRKEQEELCRYYYDTYNLHIIIARSFPHIGPGQQPIFVVSDFAKQIAEIENGKEPVIRVGNLKARRDFIDVRDVVKAYLLGVEKGKTGEIYNICSGTSYSIKEILDMLLSLTTVKIKVKQDLQRVRQNDIPDLRGDNSKFFQQTGWSPRIALKTTLVDVLTYWRKNL